MCGHGIIALTKVTLDTGMLEKSGPEATIRVDTPAGQITSIAEMANGTVDRVRFRNVASFVDSLDNVVNVEGVGEVMFDLAFGGAYYAYVDAASLGMEWPPVDSMQLIDLGRRIKQAVVADRDIHHPDHPDLGFLYGVIFSGPAMDPSHHRRNVCIFADGEVDRSPTGTGVSGHVAIEAARGTLSPGERIVVESIVGSRFEGTFADSTRVGDSDAVIPEISGTAHITGKAEFWFDPADSLNPGFLLR